MEKNISDQSVSLSQKNRRRKIWHKVVSVMASVVVFCTTYALILPAITMTEEYYCGQEEHTHGEECYQNGPTKVSVCTVLPHQHETRCYDSNGKLVCGVADFLLHTHGAICYDSNQKLVCQLPEHTLHIHSEDCYLGEYIYSCGKQAGEGHVHEEECYRTEDTFTCELLEQDPHLHDDSCYSLTEKLICTQEECDSHYHGDACYETVQALSCTTPEHEAHFHSDGCYSYSDVLSCGMTESTGHFHSESCYGTETVLACGMDGVEDHNHDDSCYTVNSILICGSGEYPGHTHDGSCYSRQSNLVCGQNETAGHVHDTAACYSDQNNLICTMKETPGHFHDDSCYGEEKTLQCTLVEGNGHLHTQETCYTQMQVLQCTIPEGEPHQHDENCQLLSEPVLICNKQETEPGTHQPECLTDSETFICGKVVAMEHIHTELCFHTEELVEPKLICELEEHVHELVCTSDITADVETAEIWRTTLPGSDTFTGKPADNLLAVAESQLGYQESTRNFIVTEAEERKGYTRYGQWYGDPYGDWCAMYVSFCLHYSGIPKEVIPYESGCQHWVDKLSGLGLYQPEGEYTPIPGDVVFFGEQQTGASHVGIIVEVTQTDIKTIEGNTSDSVAYNTYSYPNGDGYILGYASLDSVHSRGIELGLMQPIPEEPETEETVSEETQTAEMISLEAVWNGWNLTLEASENAFAIENEQLLYTVRENTEESILMKIRDILGEDTSFDVLQMQVLLEEEPVQPSTPILLKMIPCEQADYPEKMYVLADTESCSLEEMELGTQEDGSILIELTELTTFVLQYSESEEVPGASEEICLEAEYEQWKILLKAPAGAFGEDVSDLVLRVQAPQETVVAAMQEQFGSEIDSTLLDIQVLAGEKTVQPQVPVQLMFQPVTQQQSEETSLAVYRVTEEVGFESVDTNVDAEGYITLETDQISALVFICESAKEVPTDIHLETKLEDLTIRVIAPVEAFDAEASQIQLAAQMLSEEQLILLSEQLDQKTIDAAVQLKILLGEKILQPAVPIELMIQKESAPYGAEDPVLGYFVTEEKALTLQEISLSVNEEGYASAKVEQVGSFVLALPEEEKEPVRLETTYKDILIQLSAPETAFEQPATELILSVTELDEETKTAVSEALGEEAASIGLAVRLLHGEESAQPIEPVELTFVIQDETLATEKLELYEVLSGEAITLKELEVMQTDKQYSLQRETLGGYVIAYPKPYNGVVLETQWGNLQITMRAPVEAFVSAPGMPELTAEVLDEAVLDSIRGKLSSYKQISGVDLKLMVEDTQVLPEVPVELLFHSLDDTFRNATALEVYQYSGDPETGSIGLTELAGTKDDVSGLKVTTNQLTGLVISYEDPYEGIQLEADYGDIHIRLRAPYDAFPVTAENLSLLVTEPEESMKASIAESMGEEQAYFAVDIQILCDGEPIQPNGDVQVIFEMKNDPFPDADAVEIYHAVEDTENQMLHMQEVEGGYDNGNVVMETNHFSTYVVTAAEDTIVAYADAPPNTWQEALTDRSSYIGVASEGYTDSPYTNTRQFEGANITSLTNSGGTVYVGGRWGIYYDYAFYAETFWDGKKPVRITSDPGHQNDLRKSLYSDWILEDTADPYGALKIDNVNLDLWGLANQKFELYGRGNKIVIGENVNTDDLMGHSPPYIYGGSRTNDSTTSGYPTNVVVTSGRWGLVMGGGGADVNDGTQVTIRDSAEVGIIYGGGIDDGDVNKGSSENATNVYIEGGKVTEVYGGNQTTTEGIKVNGDIHIDVSGGQVGTIHAGNDHRGVEDGEKLAGSKVRGGAVVNIYNTGSVTNVVGDYMHYDSVYGDQLITLKSASGDYTMKGRHIQDLVELNIHSNNNFGYMDYWDIVRINSLNANAAPNSVNVTSNQGVVTMGDRVVNNIGSEYIGRIEVTNGGCFYVKDNCFINFMNEINTTSEEGVTSFNLNHAWMGESTEDRRAWSMLAVEGSCIEASSAATDLFTLSNPCDGGYAGLRIKGNVEGYSTLEACGEPMYSTGDTYYYYVVADSSDNGGKAFREPEGAPYVVCYRYLDDGRIGWYLRERPVLTMTNSLVRVGTEGTLTPTENGFYEGCPAHYMIMHVDMKGFAYEWSSTPGKNRVDFNWSVFEGYENATETTGGISLETMADIGNNIYSTSNPNGIFANVEYNAMGSDEGSSEQTPRVSSFYVIIDTSKAVEPRYYDVSSSFHYVRGEDDYDDLRVGQTVDAARCTYDFDKTGDINETMTADGYNDSVMTTYAYINDIPPMGKDDALMRVYLPEGVSAGSFTVSEPDNYFRFVEKDNEFLAKLVTNSAVNQDYASENDEVYNKQFAVTMQRNGGSQLDLCNGVSFSNLSGKEAINCWVHSYKGVDYEDISRETSDGLQLQLQLNSLTKNGSAVGTGDPSTVNNGELRIKVLPVGTVIEMTKVNVKKIVMRDNIDPNAAFDFLLSYEKKDEDGQTVIHEERFQLKHGETQSVIVPVETEITVQEISHDGYWVQIESTMTALVSDELIEGDTVEALAETTIDPDTLIYNDTVILTTPAQEDIVEGEEQEVVFYNSAGAELPESGGIGTQIYTLLGLLLTLGAMALFWMHRRERGTVC